MNNDQRKYLVGRIEALHKAEEEALRKEMPKEPNLQNYLIAAILDGSIKYLPTEKVKESIREIVLKLGPGDNLLGSDSRSIYGDRDNGKLAIRPEVIFEMPENYLEARRRYEEAKAEWKKKSEALNHAKETIILKINLGSNKVLDKLIEQADDLADLNLVNTRLVLSDGPAKAIPGAKAPKELAE